MIAPVVNVLIVEDNKHVCDLVRQGLAGSARREMRDVTFTFSTAEDGAAALELLRTRSFDAAIVDVYLPVLDGASLIQQARTSLGLTKLPIITMSAGSDRCADAARWQALQYFWINPSGFAKSSRRCVSYSAFSAFRCLAQDRSIRSAPLCKQRMGSVVMGSG